ncbi:MAG: HlyD family type I secretion periplasmic adaptor subunit [Alphaproteobacteria bacterium]
MTAKALAGTPDRGPRIAGPRIAGPVAASLLAIAAFVGGFGAWSWLAPLSSAVIASGVVRADTKPIQHLEGGVVAEILVHEVQAVTAGQVLVRLDDVNALADNTGLANQLYAAKGEEARLLAESRGADEIMFPAEVLAQAGTHQIDQILRGQRELFQARRASYETTLQGLEHRIEQHEASITAGLAQKVAVTRQFELIREEVAATEYLYNEGLSAKPKLLALQRAQAELESQISGADAAIAAAREAIAEIRSQIATLGTDRDTQVAGELYDVQRERADMEERLKKASSRLERIDVVAPEDGTVLGLGVLAPGAVLSAGQAIMELVPAGEPLSIDARVQPTDIDSVDPGLPAEVRLIALKRRITPTLKGVVTRVSADAITDAQFGGAYYMARIEIDPGQVEGVIPGGLYPGSPTDVMILTGERTLIEYLLQPITDGLARAFREP